MGVNGAAFPSAQVAPIMPARDFETTGRFYEALGFAVVSRYQLPDAYLIVRRGGVELHFFPHFDLDPATSYAGCYIRVADVALSFDAAKQIGLPRAGVPALWRYVTGPVACANSP